MAEDEIRIRHKQMLTLYDECNTLLSTFKGKKSSPGEKKNIHAELKRKLADYVSTLENFKIELSSIPHNASNALDIKSEYQKHSVTHRKRLKELKSEIEWAGTSLATADRDELFGDLKEAPGHDLDTVEGRKNQALDMLDDSKSSLQRTLAMTNNTVGIGRDVVVKLDQQTEQLEHVFEDLTEMEQVLDRSKRVMVKMVRGMQTDKYLWCLIGMVFFGIVGVIVYEIGWGGGDPVKQSIDN